MPSRFPRFSESPTNPLGQMLVPLSVSAQLDQNWLGPTYLHHYMYVIVVKLWANRPIMLYWPTPNRLNGKHETLK